jgi:hypothetical protein
MDPLLGTVAENGLAANAAAKADYPGEQTAPVMVDRDGRQVVRLADAGPFEEGDKRWEQRLTVSIPPSSLADQLLVADRPCRFLETFGYADGTTPAAFYYVQLHNSAYALTGGEVPVFEFPVDQNRGSFSLAYGHDFDTGLVLALSTTQGSFTGGTNKLCATVKVLAGGG